MTTPKYFLVTHSGMPSIIVTATKYPDTPSGGSVSGPFDTQEDLWKKCQLLDLTCKECYGYIQTSYCEPTRSQLIRRNLCFTCNFWTNVLSQSPVVIDGSAYTIVPDDPSPHSFKGFGGRKFKIRHNDGKITLTHNLWHRGAIPNHFRKRLPNNAAFVQAPAKVF